jgi:glycosyltransferase involved in cell wall biosynthesis
MMTKSVAIIGTRGYPSYYGGFETAVRKLAPYLAERGWDVTVYARKGSTRGDDPLVDERVTSVVTRGIESRSLSTLSYGFTSTLDAARRKPDVALVMNVANGYFLPILRARGIPSLVNVDGIEWNRAKWGRIARGIFHLGARVAAKFGTRMVYDSREIARLWGLEFKLDGDFIPYGGDVHGPLPLEPGFDHRGYVLVVARFVPENTIEEFFEAAHQISQRWPVIIVGSTGYGGDIDDQARKLSEENENVHWFGHVSDDRRLHALWQHSGAYFHGHSVGGTNPALVQAMALGAPVVARDTPYNREVLGENGAFCDPDADSIVREITDLMSSEDRQTRLSEQGQLRASEVYSWEGVLASYETALQKLADQSKSPSRRKRGR